MEDRREMEHSDMDTGNPTDTHTRDAKLARREAALIRRELDVAAREAELRDDGPWEPQLPGRRRRYSVALAVLGAFLVAVALFLSGNPGGRWGEGLAGVALLALALALKRP
jgi:hypothetical protein